MRDYLGDGFVIGKLGKNMNAMQVNATQLALFPYLEHEQAERPVNFIPVYDAWLGEAEERYLLDTVQSGWISSLGKYVTEFEQEFAAFCGVGEGISTSNGTTALHLILHALGIGSGDEVIVPTLTFIASASTVEHTGAQPVFADVDGETWTLDPREVERLITPRTKAIMPVHLYGHPAAMDTLIEIADAHNLYVIEDAAEAHGAAVGKRRAGSLGDAAAFSFYANKIITTGEGGMVTTDDPEFAARCRMLRDHAMPPERRYWHDEIGFNYRMTNMQAAVGVGQMQRIDEFVERKREIAHLYNLLLADLPGITRPAERAGYTNVYWMYSVLVGDPFSLTRDAVIQELRAHGIDSRPFFHPLDTLPPYVSERPRPTSLRLGQTGLNLPSFPKLTDEQVIYVCDTLRKLAG